jgi:hypothetical protein
VKGVTNTASAHSMEFEQAISQLFIADMCIWIMHLGTLWVQGN